MSTDLLVILLLAMGVAWFWVSRRQVVSQAGSSGVRGMHSLPSLLRCLYFAGRFAAGFCAVGGLDWV